jgi:hypothetical protein
LAKCPSNSLTGGVLNKKCKIKCINGQKDQGCDVHMAVVIQGHNVQKLLTLQGRSRQAIKSRDFMTKY